jgi:ubiquinone/menaquinone biosynthesis C-methylase UbiE
MHALKEIVKLFDTVVEKYDSWYDSEAGKIVLKTEAEMLRRALPEGLGVEIGAGTCRFSSLLSDGRSIICLEPSTSMLMYGYMRGRCPEALAAVAEYSPLRSGCVSFAYMVTVLEFLEEPVKVIAEVRRILREGGTIAVLFIERESSWGKLYRDAASKGLDPVFARARFYSAEEVDELLREAGFKVKRHLRALDYPPLTVPERPPRIFEEKCEDCGVTLVVGAK